MLYLFPTFHTVLAVGLVMVGLNQSRGSIGVVRAAAEPIKPRRTMGREEKESMTEQGLWGVRGVMALLGALNGKAYTRQALYVWFDVLNVISGRSYDFRNDRVLSREMEWPQRCHCIYSRFPNMMRNSRNTLRWTKIDRSALSLNSHT
jgi:hypothetical protein